MTRACSNTMVGGPGAVGTAPDRGQPLVRGVVVNDRTCSVAGCGSPVNARGWCNAHYLKWLKYGDPLSPSFRARITPAERFWEKVVKTDTCWLWTGHIDGGGYGRFRPRASRSPFAHRWAYEEVVGPVPEGLELDHVCRVRHCVNPDHLEPVTHRENILRSDNFMAHRARQTHCKWGHEFTPENTIARPGGLRGCRECKRLSR
jgi:hypothetical protein